MKTKYHKLPRKRLLSGLILIQLYNKRSFKNLFNKIYTGSLLNYGRAMVFGNRQGPNVVNNLMLTMPDHISETKRYFIKKLLCR